MDYEWKDPVSPFEWHTVAFRWHLEKDLPPLRSEKPVDMVVFHVPGENWTYMYDFSTDGKLLVLKNYGFWLQELIRVSRSGE